MLIFLIFFTDIDELMKCSEDLEIFNYFFFEY